MKTLLLYFLIVLPGITASAQQVITSTSYSGSAGGYMVDWTLGETVIETFTGSNHILTQGLHQTEFLATSLQDVEVPGLLVRVYPNPVSDWLMVEVVQTMGGLFRYELFDVTGRKMLIKVMQSNTEEIDTGGFLPGVYFLRILSDDEHLTTCKIIKK